jgi:hypothetical protein
MVGENRLGNVVLQMLLNWEFTHAKDAKDGKVYMGFIFIGEEIAHAKAAKDGNPTSLSLGKPR